MALKYDQINFYVGFGFSNSFALLNLLFMYFDGFRQTYIKYI